MRKLVLAVVAILVVSPALLAQQPPADESKLVQISPREGGWDVVELFRTISEYTGRSIVYDPNAPQIRGKKIQFEGTQTVPRDRIFEWFQSLLSFQRIVLVPVGPDKHEQWMALDLNAPQIMNRPIFVQEDEILNWADRDGVYVVTTITVKNLTDTSRARNALAQLSTRQIGRINDVPGNLAFVVGDFAPVVASMYQLLKAMDVKPMEYSPVARTYLLDNAVASEVEPILLDLLQTAVTTPGRGRAGRPGNVGVPEKPEPQIIADTRQDAIIVYAVPEDQEEIAALIDLLDQPVKYKRGNIHFVEVKHTNASELADLLTELIRGTGIGRGTTGRNTRRPTPGAPGSPGSLTGAQGEPVIVADNRTNSLLIQATATQLDDLTDLIDKIDIPRDQVLVEAALVELSVDDLVRFGVELASATTQKDLNERTFFGMNQLGLSALTDSDGDGIPDINIPAVSVDGSTTGLTAGIFDNNRFPVIMQALTTTSRARALSMPSVVVEDGSQATMRVTDEVPFSIRTIGAGGETNFSVDTSTAEISLDISPHISSDNYLRLHIHQTVQSFRSQTSEDLPPPVTGREIETDIVIPDGYTVVLGGLLDEKSSDSESGIPYLKDIPVLGYLFRSNRNSEATTSLFLFVTARILAGTNHDFKDYHEVTWQRKLLADKLLDEAIQIHFSRFRGEEQEKDQLDRIQDTGFIDRPRYKDATIPDMSPAEARRRFEQISRENREEEEK